MRDRRGDQHGEQAVAERAQRDEGQGADEEGLAVDAQFDGAENASDLLRGWHAGIKDVAVYLPLVRLSLPDDDILAPVQHLVALTLKNVPADFRRRIAIAFCFYGLKFDRLDARIYKRLEECLLRISLRV